MAILKLNEDPLLQLAPGFRDMFRACPLVHGLTRSLAKVSRDHVILAPPAFRMLYSFALVSLRLSALYERAYMR